MELNEKRIHRVVLTGGPCGGKTTGQAHLRSFFENVGWKVFVVPELATVFLSGGIKFLQLSKAQRIKFQEDLLSVQLQFEDTFYRIANEFNQNVLIINDRGTMDISAYIENKDWLEILNKRPTPVSEADLYARYDQVIQLVTAASGAESFYTISGARSEDIQTAKDIDQKTNLAWTEHSTFDSVDNSTDFQMKMDRMVGLVCRQLGILVGNTLDCTWKKVKFVVQKPIPEFPPELKFRDFFVVYDYLSSSNEDVRARLRKRGREDRWNYTHAIRRPIEGQSIEAKTVLSSREYALMLTQRDMNHFSVYITRRCFLLNDQYFQLDMYEKEKPCHSRCNDLVLLETYTSLPSTGMLAKLPTFLTIGAEVTGDARFCMFNLSLKSDWERENNTNPLFSSLVSSRSSDFNVNVNRSNPSIE